MNPQTPAHHGTRPRPTRRVAGGEIHGTGWSGREENADSVKNDPISALSHLAPGRSPAYIETGCRWPRSCRSVRTSNGSNRGSARVAWCFHSLFGCRPHVAWGVHRLDVPAVPPFPTQVFLTQVFSTQAPRPGFGSSRYAAMRDFRALRTRALRTRTLKSRTFNPNPADATQAHAPGSPTSQTRFTPRSGPNTRSRRIPRPPRFQ